MITWPDPFNFETCVDEAFTSGAFRSAVNATVDQPWCMQEFEKLSVSLTFCLLIAA
jgi:hypothetical protein